jgi:hypothetical protein
MANPMNARNGTTSTRIADMGIISNKLRASARGQQCTFEIVGICNHDPETTVLCHLPSDVKGMGNKSDDFHAAFGCANCHQAIDLHWLPREEELYYILRGLQRTMRYWIERGLVVIPGNLTPKVAPKTSKTMPPRKPSWRVSPLHEGD